MAAITFDTLKFVHRLKDSGISEVQAEAIAEAFKEASGEAELATKRDVERLEGQMREMELKIEARMAENKADLIRWVVGVGILQLTFIAALLLKLLPS